MSFYYDDMMNDINQTMSLYLYSIDDDKLKSNNWKTRTSDDITNLPTRANNNPLTINSSNGGNVIELLRLPLKNQMSISNAFNWGGAPSAIKSISANLRASLTQAAIDLRQGAETVSAIGQSFADYSQYSIFNANEWSQVFKGIENTINIPFEGTIVNYVDNTTDNLPIDQITHLLNNIYPDLEQSKNTDGTEKTFKDYFNTAMKSRTNNNSSSNIFSSLWSTVTSFLKAGAYTLTEEEINDTSGTIVIRPPHKYRGTPKEFLEGEWMTGTLAVRYGERYIYNLLLTNINLTFSKEYILGDGTSSNSPSYIDINLGLKPAHLVTPNDLLSYMRVTNTRSTPEVSPEDDLYSSDNVFDSGVRDNYV